MTVLFDSLSGICLYDHDCPDETVLAAVLHDLIEDTDCTIIEVEQEFGRPVAQLVAANTFSTTAATGIY
jgi:(p)ppGpp synthase/HD superfamily hydrolase